MKSLDLITLGIKSKTTEELAKVNKDKIKVTTNDDHYILINIKAAIIIANGLLLYNMNLENELQIQVADSMFKDTVDKMVASEIGVEVPVKNL